MTRGMVVTFTFAVLMCVIIFDYIELRWFTPIYYSNIILVPNFIAIYFVPHGLNMSIYTMLYIDPVTQSVIEQFVYRSILALSSNLIEQT